MKYPHGMGSMGKKKPAKKGKKKRRMTIREASVAKPQSMNSGLNRVRGGY